MQIKLTPTHSNAWTLNNTAARASYVVSEIIYRNRGLPRAILDEKYTAMQKGVFPFLRGTNHLFWDDLGTDALLSTFGNTVQTRTWLSGDCHLENFGSFTNSAGTALYDLNDFDASVIADYQLDVWRVAIAMHINMHQYAVGTPEEKVARVDMLLDQYLTSILTFASGNDEVTSLMTVGPAGKSYLTKSITDAAALTTAALLTKYTTIDIDNKRVFQNITVNADLGPASQSDKDAIIASMPAYGASLSGPIAYSTSYFAVKDIAVRLHAGLGSLGLPRYYVLIEGPTNADTDDVILDFKFQPEPAAFNNLNAGAVAATNSVAATSNKRAVWGYRSLSYLPDAYLGYTTVDGMLFAVRERNPHKKDLDADKFTSKSDHEYMAPVWGQILAAAHARADVDSPSSGITYDVDAAVAALVTGKAIEFKANVHAAIDGYVEQVLFDFAAFNATLATLIPEWSTAPTLAPTAAPAVGSTAAPAAGSTAAPAAGATKSPMRAGGGLSTTSPAKSAANSFDAPLLGAVMCVAAVLAM
ncbi:hypothetical protein BASA81_002138 [Batrachochytrium salamandrivorans]|nr:hypothetical protein BASA81_002138 [Batrachochytrium salamandrivorans]